MKFVDCPATHIKSNWVFDTDASIEEQKSFAAARVRDIFFEAIAEAMERANLKRADLAKRLGTTRSAITRLLSSDNPTIKTIGKALWACDLEVGDVELRPFGDTWKRNEEIRGTFLVTTSGSAPAVELQSAFAFEQVNYKVVLSANAAA